MTVTNKVTIATRILKSLLLNQTPNYAVAFFDGRCNMLCDFCCHAAMDARKTPMMSAEQWGLVFKKSKCLIQLTITGGEPFIRDDLVEIIDNIILACGVPRVSINTNGFYTSKVVDFLPKLINKHKNTEFTLSISLDGQEETHDKVRNFKGAYKSVLKTIDLIKEYRKLTNFYLKLSSVLTNENKNDLAVLLDQTVTWPIDFHEVILIRDVPKKDQLKLKDSYTQLSRAQHQRASKVWKKSFNSKLFEKIYLETIKRIDSEKVFSPCLAGGRFIEIFPDGVVRGCEIEKMWDKSEIGKVDGHTRDIVDVIKSKEAKNFREIAKKCTCTFECANVISTVYNPKQWPSLV